MAGVPEIQPELQQEALPSPAQPRPKLLDDAGRGLSELGSAVAEVGLGAYHRAATDFAEDKNAQYQQLALQIRDKFRQLHMLDAAKNHDSATQAIEQARQVIEQGITSDHARSLYKTNSLRTARIVQESVDQHFEEEDNKYHKFAYEQGQSADTALLAKIAADPAYNDKSVGDIVKRMHDRATDFVQGADEATAKDFADNAVRRGTDALFDVLLNPKANRDPTMVKAELKKYSDLNQVDKSTQVRAESLLGAGEVNAWVAKTTTGDDWQRVSAVRDADGKLIHDPEGFIPREALTKALGSIAGDPRFKEKAEAITKYWDAQDSAFKRAGAQLLDIVVGNGAIGKTNDPDWVKYQMLHPLDALQFTHKQAQWKYAQDRHAQVDAKQVSGVAAGATKVWLDEMSHEQISTVTPEQVKEQLYRQSPGGALAIDPRDVDKTLEHLRILKDHSVDHVEKRFHAIATDELARAFNGYRPKILAAMGQAYRFLDDQYSASGGKLTERDLRDALFKEASKQNGVAGSSWFGSIPLLTYQSPRVAAPALQKTMEVTRGKEPAAKGQWYRYPDDLPGTHRVRGG